MTFSTGDVLSATFMNSAVVNALLGVTQTTSTTNNSSTAGATTILTLNVTIPSGLHSTMSVLVIGTCGQVITPAGVGAVISITNATSSGTDFTTSGNMSGGITVIKTDLNPAAGAKSYVMSILTSVNSSNVSARGAVLMALVV